MGLKLNFCFITPKSHILAWFHVFCAIARKNSSTGLTCARASEKRYKIHKNIFCYILRICPQALSGWICTKFGIGGPRGRNQLCRIFFRSVQGYWFCRGLKFAYSHKNWRSPLTLSELLFRLWYTELQQMIYQTKRILALLLSITSALARRIYDKSSS